MDLVYTIAMGKRRFGWAAALMADSLRRWGRFEGEIVVFSDRALCLPEGVRLIRITDPQAVAQPKWMKMHARHHIDFAQYDRVGFIDADIIVRGPFAPFLEATSGGRMVCVDDLGQPIGAGLSFRCLSAEEKERYGQRVKGVNGGFYVASGAALPDWLTAWEQMQIDNLHVPGEGFCQSGVNACMLRGQIPVTRFDGVMWFPKRDPDRQRCQDDAPLVHFHGINRHFSRYWRMRCFHRGLKKGRCLLEHWQAPEAIPFSLPA